LIDELVAEDFDEKLLNNHTYKKFSTRLAINQNALGKNKTKTQQCEKTAILEDSSLGILITVTGLLWVASFIFAVMKAVYNDKDNVRRVNVETAEFFIYPSLATIQVVSAIFSRKKISEKKEKQAYEIMQKLLERKPSIEAEINLINKAVFFLKYFLGINSYQIGKDAGENAKLDNILIAKIASKQNHSVYNNIIAMVADRHVDDDLIITNIVRAHISSEHSENLNDNDVAVLLRQQNISALFIHIIGLIEEKPLILDLFLGQVADLFSKKIKLYTMRLLTEIFQFDSVGSTLNNAQDLAKNFFHIMNTVLNRYSNKPFELDMIYNSLSSLSEEQHSALTRHVKSELNQQVFSDDWLTDLVSIFTSPARIADKLGNYPAKSMFKNIGLSDKS